MTAAYGFSTLVSFENKPIVGFRLGTWISINIFSGGLSTTYYTDFNLGTVKITPEFGLCVTRYKIAVGFNAPRVENKNFQPISKLNMQLMVNYLLRLKTVKAKETYPLSKK